MKNVKFPVRVFMEDKSVVCYDETDFDIDFCDYQMVTSAGGIVMRDNGEVLMISRLGKWDFPKGKVEPKEKISVAAIREVIEETGLVTIDVVSYLGDVWHTYGYKDKNVIKQTCWFLMMCKDDMPLIPQVEEDIQSVVWVPIDQVGEKLQDSYASLRYFWHKVFNSIG